MHTTFKKQLPGMERHYLMTSHMDEHIATSRPTLASSVRQSVTHRHAHTFFDTIRTFSLHRGS